MTLKIVNIVGARPNFMKIAPLMEEYKKYPDVEPILVHTGQHYDEKMSDLFFRQLGIPEPDINLGIGSGSHAQQTAEIMKCFEPVLLAHRPDAVMVVGDVNSTIACGLVAVKMGIQLVHYEAGLRSFDLSMPEEINRILTDSISDLLLCTEQSGIDNLASAGIKSTKTHLVGNLMIDTLHRHKSQASKSSILDDLGLAGHAYCVLTLHRPSNVDVEGTLADIIEALRTVQSEMKVVFPVHPRTLERIEAYNLTSQIKELPNLQMTGPLGYLDFLKLMDHASLIMTDSGGIQEEACVLGVPCLTLRNSTERPATLEGGANLIVGTNPDTIIKGFRTHCSGGRKSYTMPPLWDGCAATRIVKILMQITN